MSRKTTGAAGLILLIGCLTGIPVYPAQGDDDPLPAAQTVIQEPSPSPYEQTERPAPHVDDPPPATSPQFHPQAPTATQAEPPDVATAASGDLITAIMQLREALRRQPDLVQTRLDLGSALYQLGDLDSAIETFHEAVRRSPDFSDARIKLATALMAKHEWGGAREELEHALAQHPDLPHALYALGIVRYRLGDHAGAIEAYRRLLLLTPGYADAHYNLGLVLKLANQDEPAAYEFLAAAAAGLPHAQYFLGAAYAAGLGIERNLPAAIGWWFRAADQGESQAREALAQLRRAALLKGPQSTEETRAAFAEFRAALWRDFPDLPRAGAGDSVGVTLLEHGRVKEAVPVLIREGAALSESAQSALEVVYEHGIAGQVDPYDVRILASWKTLADEGLPRPRLALARVYSRGLGVPQDVRKAAGLLKHVTGEAAKELLKEITAMQPTGAQAARNTTSHPLP
ncbi:MAG TPA: tetratricopeptide repeat protein [Nitrospiraceae bacterium]|nr:tetratricopeptide repeat protein [Nitrospiraceae bacterium]